MTRHRFDFFANYQGAYLKADDEFEFVSARTEGNIDTELTISGSRFAKCFRTEVQNFQGCQIRTGAKKFNSGGDG
jgi:hypothetical protein